MIVLVQLPSRCARILYHFPLTKMYDQQRRIVYQNPFAYDLAFLFITSIRKKGAFLGVNIVFSFANTLVLLWNQNVSEVAVTTTTVQDHLVFLVPIFDRKWKIRK